MTQENVSLKSEFYDKAAAPRELVIFTSASLIAHQHLNGLMPFFEANNIKPVIFLTPDCTSPRATIPSLLRYDYLEAGIVNDVIFPALDASKTKKHLTPTFNELVQRHNCTAQKVQKMIDPEIVAAIESPNFMGAISIYQDVIFKEPLINAVKERGFFWNLHPAVLPENQGLYLAFWSLLNGRDQHGYTLHEIDAGIDTGRIISRHEGPLDKNKNILSSYISFVNDGSALVRDALATYLEKGAVDYTPIVKGETHYYTFPTEADISTAWMKNVRLWGTPEEMLQLYTGIFGNEKGLVNRIRKALDALDPEQDNAPAWPAPLPTAPEAPKDTQRRKGGPLPPFIQAP